MVNRYFLGAAVLVALAAGVLLVADCAGFQEPADYMPLGGGHFWFYKDITSSVHPDSLKDTTKVVNEYRRRVLGQVTLDNGKDAWEIEVETGSGYRDTVYWHMRKDSVWVYQSKADDDPRLWLVTTFSEGRSWDLPNGMAVCVGKELVEVDAGRFEKSWKIKFVSGFDADHESFLWFAPNVGLVKTLAVEESQGRIWIYSLELEEYNTE